MANTHLIPHSRPTLPVGDEWREVTDLLEPGWAADGPVTRRFEEELARVMGAVGAVAVNSGSSALQLALMSLDLQPGDEVLIPAYCCAAVMNAVAAAGGTPVLVDCERAGYNLCPELAAAAVTPRTRAIVLAQMFGIPSDPEPFRRLGITLIEDCAQSLGASWNGQPVGAAGDLAIGSFFATKVITTGHGGVVVSRDPARVARIRDLVEYDNRDEWSTRYNFRISEMQAALGVWQLRRLAGFLKRREEIAVWYDSRFRSAGLCPGSAHYGEGAIRYRYLLRARDATTAVESLRDLGVDAKRPVFQPLSRYGVGEAPRAEQADREVVSLPIYPTLTDDDSRVVAEAVLSLRDLWIHEV